MEHVADVVFPDTFPVACHTKNIGPGSTFVAIKGDEQDGITYIPEALKRGASVIVVQDDVHLSDATINLIKQAGATVKYVANSRQSLAILSAKMHGYPAKKLRIIGITGTKGKTSTSFMLEHIVRGASYKTALLSSVHNKIGNQIFKASLTTEHPDYLHAFFALCVQAGTDFVVMEVSAQAFSLHRLHGLLFDAALFTNFDQEHGEFYADLEDYFAAKCLLFKQLKPGAPGLINADDVKGQELLRCYPQLRSFSVHNAMADYCAQEYAATKFFSWKLINEKKEYVVTCQSLMGVFNVYNTLAAISLAHSLGVSFESCVQGIACFSGTPGRFERHNLPNGATCFIDHAHNSSSFRAALSALRKITDHLIVVFGAGGSRDAKKRPDMGAIAAHYADHVILTSDNPRFEDPTIIINTIRVGIDAKNQNKVIAEPDREDAIKKA